jgi:hypothetical protein
VVCFDQVNAQAVLVGSRLSCASRTDAKKPHRAENTKNAADDVSRPVTSERQPALSAALLTNQGKIPLSRRSLAHGPARTVQ